MPQDRRIACLESRAAKWHDLLSDAINEHRASDGKMPGKSPKNMAIFHGWDS